MYETEKKQTMLVYIFVAFVELFGLIMTGYTKNGWWFGGSLIFVAVAFLAWLIYSIFRED